MERKLYGKVQLKGVMRALTGLHIGGSKESLDIGGIDAPILRHPVTLEPYIPGSSLKGKMRSLLELMFYAEGKVEIKATRENQKKPMYMHICEDWDSAAKCPVCRLFGSSGDFNFPSRLRVRDLRLTEVFRNQSEYWEEYKSENAIDRITSMADPRTIERVPEGIEFEFEIVYNVEKKEDLKDDLLNLLTAMQILEDDYLGGYGSRGYGKVQFNFSNVIAKPLSYYLGNESPSEFLVSGEGNSVEAVKEIIEEKAGEMEKIFFRLNDGGNM